MHRKILILLTLVCTAYLNGCATVPMASVENDEARKYFSSPSPGTAGLYIYRNSSFGGALKKFIYLDGELVAESAPMTYFYFEVQGGKRKLSTESEFSENDLIVDVEQGRNYFVRQTMKMGVFVHGAKLELVPEEEGKRDVLVCKLANNLKGNVVVNMEEIRARKISSQSEPGGDKSALDYYGQAEEEIGTQTYDKNLWAKALVEVGGDEQKRKARYIELRANQLYSEKAVTTSNVVPDVQLDSYSAVSGTYRSELSKNLLNHFKRTSIEIKLVQSGKKITGTFVGAKGYIDGEIDGNTLKYVARPPYGNWSIGGKWVFTDGYNKAAGDAGYHVTKGFWNLTKIE